MSNVVDFQKMLLEARLEQAKQQEQDRKEMLELEEERINNLSLQILVDVVETMQECGYDIRDNPECVKDLLLVMEAMGGVMHRVIGDKPPIHEVSDGLFAYDYEQCEDLLNVFIQNHGVFT